MSWNADIAYAFTPYKIFTLPLGVWPLQKYNTFSLVRAIVCGVSVTMMMFSLFLEANYGSGDAFVKVDILMVMSCNILAALKLLLFRLYADNLIRNYSSAVNDYLAIDSEEKRTIMRRHAFLGRMVCCSILFFTYLALVIFMLTSMFGNEEDVQVNVSVTNQLTELPMPLTFLGDVHMSTSIYMLVSLVQSIVMTITSTSNCGNDSLFLAIVLHICGQMEILKIDISNYGVKSKNLVEDFSVLISRHRYLMELAELLVDVISFVLLVQLMISSFIISLIGFQLILAMKSHNAVMIIKTIAVLCALLLQLFFYSFVGDYLKCQMEEVAESIYNSNWYNLPTKVMRNVVFVIMQSQQPVQLLAGRFFSVNLKAYMTIIKTSLSYLSVLRVMVDT